MSFNVSLKRNANRNNILMTAYPLGDAPALIGGGGNDAFWDAKYTAWIDTLRGASATTYYVDPVAGNNTNPGTTGLPFADPTAAYAVMSGGDEIVIRGNGITITDDDNFAFNDFEHSIPAGISRTNRTIIRAETPFGVRIKFQANTRHFNFEAIKFDTNSFMFVDGFIIDWLNDGGDPENVATMLAPENIMTRTIFRRDQLLTFGSFVVASGNYSLLQDVHCVGGSRYGIQMGAGTTGAGGKGVVRRSIQRVDFYGANQPQAPFSLYGNDGGFLSGEAEFQNCYPVDGPYIDTTLGVFSYTWGGFYHPKNAFDIRHRGCGVFNQGGRAGFWVTDNANAHSYVLEDCAVVGENPIKYGTRNGVHANTNGTADRLTFVDVDGVDLNNGVTANNVYSGVPPVNIFNPLNGADLRYCYGEFGTVWGEVGFDTITTDKLWNFPYETKIREIFREPLPSPTGYTPPTNDSLRGFCAANQTFSKYIAGFGTGDPATVLAGLYP